MLLFNKHHIFQRRVSSAFILWLAKFYLEVNQKQEGNLNYFFHLDSFLLAMALGGHRSPGTGIAILVSFLNVGERLPSSKEQCLLFGDVVEENKKIVSNLFKILMKDILLLESNIFEIVRQW